MEYEFTQTWSQEDYVAFAKNHMLSAIFKVSNIILFTVSIGYLLITPIISGGDFLFFFLGIGVLAMISLFLVYAINNSKKTYEKNKHLMTIDFVVNDEGLTYKTKEGELTKPWNEFYSFKETKDHFFIYFNKQNGLLLAKRDFSYELQSFIVKQINDHLVDKRKIKILKREDQ